MPLYLRRIEPPTCADDILLQEELIQSILVYHAVNTLITQMAREVLAFSVRIQEYFGFS